MRPPLILLPALDVSRGRAVRPGESSATFNADPLDLALAWEAAGAEWVHLVDLDAAYGTGTNTAVLRRIVAALTVPVQVSGGVRDAGSLARAEDLGPARVNLATSALLDLPWVEQVLADRGDRVAVGLDVRGRRLVARGTGEEAGDLFDVLTRLDAAGARRYVVTDVTTDRAMSGPNVALLRDVAAATGRPLIASGGVSGLADLRALRDLVPDGVEGVVLGTALAAGAFELADALTVASG